MFLKGQESRITIKANRIIFMGRHSTEVTVLLTSQSSWDGIFRLLAKNLSPKRNLHPLWWKDAK